MDEKTKIIETATKYIGTTEIGDTNDVVFNTTYYGHRVSGASAYPWCCVFVWYVFQEAGLSKLFFDGKKTALCASLADWFKAQKRWYSTPEVGDIVFFKFGTKRYTDHVGIVVGVKPDGSIETIEGNTSDKDNRNGGCVLQRVRKSNIVGYGRPQYGDASVVSTTTTTTAKSRLVKGVDLSKYNTIKNYLNLKAAGIDFAIIKIIEKNRNVEPSYMKHLNGCLNAGLNIFAVYNYIYSTTPEEARKDAQAVIRALNGRQLAVAMDVEDKCLQGLGEALADIIIAYKEEIEKAGLQFILYTGKSFYEAFLSPYKNKIGNVPIWIARYPVPEITDFNVDPDPAKKPEFNGVFMWQYTSKLRVPEACPGDLDCNIMYNIPVADKPIDFGYCTAENTLRIRRSPVDGDVLGYLGHGEKVLIYAKDPASGWYKIAPNEEKWVSYKYISK